MPDEKPPAGHEIEDPAGVATYQVPFDPVERLMATERISEAEAIRRLKDSGTDVSVSS